MKGAQLKARNVEEAGICFFNVSGGGHGAAVPQLTPNVPRESYAYLAREIKKVVDCPVAAANRNLATICLLCVYLWPITATLPSVFIRAHLWPITVLPAPANRQRTRSRSPLRRRRTFRGPTGLRAARLPSAPSERPGGETA